MGQILYFGKKIYLVLDMSYTLYNLVFSVALENVVHLSNGRCFNKFPK